MPERLVAVIKADRRILIIALICGGLFLILLASKGILGLRPMSVFLNSAMYFFFIVFVVFWRNRRLIFIERPDKLLLTLWQYETTPVRIDRVIQAMPVIIALCLFMPLFSAMKSAIPLFNEFQWDQTFIEWDRALFGMDAWRLFYPALFSPLILALIAFLYHLWIFLLYASGIFFAFHLSNRELRERFFVSYFLAWTIVGGLLAMYFSSVGPCFAYPLLGITDFQPLMAELRQANGQFPIMVLDVQDKLALWQKYGENGLGGGITAMPSMHVSLALLFFLAVRRISAKAAWVFGLFFCVICVGSVVTGYHYAVDGLVAAAATYIIWVMTGFVLNRMNDANIGPVVAGDANQPRLLDASLLRK